MKILVKFQRTLFWIMKICLYGTLLLSFMAIFSINTPFVVNPSRTMGIVIVTFVIVGWLMTAAYGRYDVGRRKSKPIIYSLSFAALITDIVTYLELMIMNTITPDIFAFSLSDLGYLVLAFCVHVVIITGFTYAGNALYFVLNPPERCCIVTDADLDVCQLLRTIEGYKKQYHICRVLDYRKVDLTQILRTVETVFIHGVPIESRGELIDFCYENRKNIYFSPEVTDVIENTAQNYMLGDTTFFYSKRSELTIEQRVLKRLFDIFVSGGLVLISSPVWIISAIAIKLEDHGSVFFKQKRATIHGDIFYVYKFRTMKEHVENYSSTKGDYRITRVGRILRRTRMDELPQLFNILRGDMSFVGPRPEMLENVYSYTQELPEFRYRLRMKAGLTGYAQIAGKYNTTPKDKLIMDMMYIENYSLWLDIKLILQTVIVLVKSDSTEGFVSQGNMDRYKVER